MQTSSETLRLRRIKNSFKSSQNEVKSANRAGAEIRRRLISFKHSNQSVQLFTNIDKRLTNLTVLERKRFYEGNFDCHA